MDYFQFIAQFLVFIKEELIQDSIVMINPIIQLNKKIIFCEMFYKS